MGLGYCSTVDRNQKAKVTSTHLVLAKQFQSFCAHLVEFGVGEGDPGLFLFIRGYYDGAVVVYACMGTKKSTFESEAAFTRFLKAWTNGGEIERGSGC